MERKTIYITIAGFLLLIICIWSSIKPSNDRIWSADQENLPYSIQYDDLIHIYNIRNFTYYNTSLYYPTYYDENYNLSELDSLWYIVEPFSKWQGSAHTFLSFGFNDSYIAVSVEIRKEKGEKFSAFKGLFKKYELMYVLGDERDLIKLRSNYRNDSVYLYPVNTTQENMRLLFIDIIKRVDELYEKPEFYNTISNTCTTNIARHINNIRPGRIPLSFALIAPGYSDKLAYKLGIINTTLPYEEIRAHYQINERALKYADDTDFSLKIREFDS